MTVTGASLRVAERVSRYSWAAATSFGSIAAGWGLAGIGRGAGIGVGAATVGAAATGRAPAAMGARRGAATGPGNGVGLAEPADGALAGFAAAAGLGAAAGLLNDLATGGLLTGLLVGLPVGLLVGLATGFAAAFAAGLALADDFAAGFLDRGVKVAIVKQGADGVLVVTADERVVVPGIPVDVVCGLGAGDAFGGSFVHGILSGWSPADSVTYANAAGAIVASRLLCSHAMPTDAEVRELLAAAGRKVPA